MLIDKNKKLYLSSQKIDSNQSYNQITNNNSIKTEAISPIARESYYFKNEILKELSKIEQRFNSKLSLNNLEMANNKKDLETKLKLLTLKIDSVSEKNYEYDSFKEKMDDLVKYKRKNEETQLINKIKMEEMNQEIKNNFDKYDKLLKRHMIPDGLVGENCQFKTFHEMIRFILDNIVILNNFKEMNNLDLKSYKVKLESLIITFRTQIENIIQNMAQFTTKSVNDSENKIKGMINIYDERLVELRAENNNYITNLTNKYEKLIIEYDNILEIKKEIYSKIDSDIKNINDLINNNYKELQTELDKYNIQYLNIKEEFEKMKISILSNRERRINYSKNLNLSSKKKKSFDEESLIIDKMANKRLSINLDKLAPSIWKKYIENNFNKIKNDLDNYNESKESNIYGIDQNKAKMRNTLSYGAMKLQRKNNSLKENKLLKIKENFQSINEEENDINNIDKQNLIIKENNKNGENEDNENMDLLSNKTISNNYKDDEEEEKEKNKEGKLNIINNHIDTEKKDINNLSINAKINNKDNTEVNYTNNKNDIINDKIKKISNFNKIKEIIKFDKSIQIEEDKITKTNNNQILKRTENSISIKDKNNINNILISKENHSSDIEFPKIDYNKRTLSTDQEPDDNIIKKINKKFQKVKKNNEFSFSSYHPREINYFKNNKNTLITTSRIENNNEYSYRSNYKAIKNKYYSVFAEKLKDRKIPNIRKMKDSISTKEIIFDPFINMKVKLYKSKSSKSNEVNDISNNNNNNNCPYIIKSANKSKENNSYINSKGEFSNIINIPPPSNTFYKSLFGVQ